MCSTQFKVFTLLYLLIGAGCTVMAYLTNQWYSLAYILIIMVALWLLFYQVEKFMWPWEKAQQDAKSKDN